jgi:hypothetical protein
MKTIQLIKSISSALLLSISTQLFGQVPGSANWSVFIDMDKFKSSPLGAAFQVENAQKEQPVMQFMETYLDFDPWTDLDSVTIHGDGTPNKAISVLNGSFNTDQLLSFLQSKDYYQLIADGEAEIHYVIFKKKEKRWMHIPNEQTILIAHSLEDIKTAISIEQGKIASTTIESIEHPLSFMLAYANFSEMANYSPRAQYLKNIEFSEIILEPQGDQLKMLMFMQARDEQFAKTLEQGIQGILAWAKIKSSGKELLNNWLNNSIKITRNNEMIEVSAQFSNADIIKKYKEAPKANWKR